MGFLMPKRTIGFKIESTPYTAETLSANDYDIAAYNVTYSPEIPMKERRLARGDFSRDISISGKRSITITFSVDFYHSGTNATPPNYFKCLRACGLKQTVHGATGVSLITDSDYTDVPATIEVVEKDEGTSPSQLVFKAKGAMGNAKVVMDNVGEPIRVEFEFKGVLVSVTDRAYGSILAPSGITSQLPEAVLNAGATFFGEGRCVNTITIDLANDVQLYSCSSSTYGYDGAHVVDRNPTLETDPDLALIATNGDYSRWTNNTTGAFLINMGSASQRLTVSAPAAQLINAYQPGDREGHVVNSESFELKRSSGNDELKILQGSE